MTNYRSFYKQRADSNMESELEGMRLETSLWCGLSYPKSRTDGIVVIVRWD